MPSFRIIALTAGSIIRLRKKHGLSPYVHGSPRVCLTTGQARQLWLCGESSIPFIPSAAVGGPLCAVLSCCTLLYTAAALWISMTLPVPHSEGFRPEWCISTMVKSEETPFWLETFDIWLPWYTGLWESGQGFHGQF